MKYMAAIFLNLGGVKTKIEIPWKEYIEYLLKDPFSLSHLPFTICKKCKPEFYFKVKKANKLKLEIGVNKAVIHANKKIINKNNIIFLLLFLSEKFRQMKGRYTAHASSLKIKNKGVLICGWTLSGKTILLLDAILNNRKVKTLTNEFTIVDKKARIVDGVRYVEIRREYDNYYPSKKFYKLSNRFEPTKISLIVYVKIYPSKSYRVKEIRFPDRNLINYETFSRVILSVDNLFPKSYNKPYPHIDTEELAKKRAKFVAKISSKIKTLFYEGGTENFFDVINEHIRG